MANRLKQHLLPGIFENLREINFGIILISTYILFEVGSLQDILDFVQPLRLPLVIACMSLGYAIYLLIIGKFKISEHKATRIFLITTIYALLYCIMSTYNPHVKNEISKLFIQYISYYIIAVTSIRTLFQLVFLLDVWLVSIMHTCFHAIMQGGLLWGSSWWSDENQVSLLASYAISWAFALLINYKKNIIKRVCYAAAIVFYVTATIVSISRGGALTMFAAGFGCWLIFKHKTRNIVIILLAAICVVSFAPEEFFQEIKTLEQGTQESTANARIYFWGMAFKMFQDNPFFGVGVGNYPLMQKYYDTEDRVTGRQMVAHSTPMQWLAEYGLVGSVLLIALNFSLIKIWIDNKALFAAKGQAKYRQIEVLTGLNHAFLISLLCFWIGAMFITVDIYPIFWIIVPFIVTLNGIIKQNAERNEK